MINQESYSIIIDFYHMSCAILKKTAPSFNIHIIPFLQPHSLPFFNQHIKHIIFDQLHLTNPNTNQPHLHLSFHPSPRTPRKKSPFRPRLRKELTIPPGPKVSAKTLLTLLVVVEPTHLNNMLVKLQIFPNK